jgi:predicted RNase H-like HicB family nuclease
LKETQFLYKIVLFKDEQTGYYVSVVPSLYGCISQGNTVSIAIDRIKEAASILLQDIIEKKKVIPNYDFDENTEINYRIKVITGPRDIKSFWKNYLKKGEKS